jgi:hypothetical protein
LLSTSPLASIVSVPPFLGAELLVAPLLELDEVLSLLLLPHPATATARHATDNSAATRVLLMRCLLGW